MVLGQLLSVTSTWSAVTTSSKPTIAQQVTDMQAANAASGRLPADVQAAFGADLQRLGAEGVSAEVVTVGSTMPDGHVVEADGTATTLAQARGDDAAVIVFYRGAWCPYCNVALRTYQLDLVPELTQRGVRLIAISPQNADGSLTDVEARELSFTVLSDPGNSVAGQLGILMTPTDAALAGQRKLGLDLREHNADGTATLPMPTVLVVDRTGVIRFVDVHPVYTERTEVADIVAAVDALPGGAAG